MLTEYEEQTYAEKQGSHEGFQIAILSGRTSKYRGNRRIEPIDEVQKELLGFFGIHALIRV